MRKHTVQGLILLGVTLLALVLLLGNSEHWTAASRLTQSMVSEEEFTALTKNRTEQPELISQLRCNDFVLPGGAGSFYYSMIEGDKLAFDPVVQIDGRRKLQIAFPARQLDEEFLRQGGGLPFVAYTGSSFARGTLYFTTLPTVSIDVLEPDSNGSLDIYDRNNRLAELNLFDNRENIPSNSRRVHSETSIRIRGASSSYLPKQSYRLSLSTLSLGDNRRSNPRALLGMREDEDWILYAGGNDPERLRNSFCNNLWYQTGARSNSFGVCLGIECRYVELVLNGEYMGLYTLMYPLDTKQVSLPENGLYYRAISYDKPSADTFQNANEETELGGWELRYPAKAHGYETWECLEDYLNHTLYETTEDFETWFYETLDEENNISLQLFLSLVQGMDNYYKNNNVIAYPQADGSYRCLLAPWDLDLTFGNQYSPDNEWHTLPYTIPPERKFKAWTLPATRMISISSSFRQKLYSTYQAMRQDEWSETALMEMVDAYEADIYFSGAMAREHSRWPTAPTSENLDEFRAFLAARLQYLDSYFVEEAQK